jgi:hypothetical protein
MLANNLVASNNQGSGRGSAKEQLEKMTKRLKMLRDTRDLTDGSVEYAINGTLCANGVDRKVYHGQCLIGPQIMKLLANRVEIMTQLEMKFLHFQDETWRRTQQLICHG